MFNLQYTKHINSKIYFKQERIPVGCVLPVLHHTGQRPLGQWSPPLPRRNMEPCSQTKSDIIQRPPPPPRTEWMTHAWGDKNIQFPPKQWMKGSLVNWICKAKSVSQQAVLILVTCSMEGCAMNRNHAFQVQKLVTFPYIRWVANGRSRKLQKGKLKFDFPSTRSHQVYCDSFLNWKR